MILLQTLQNRIKGHATGGLVVTKCKARATRSQAQTINDNSTTTVQFNVESYDPNNNFDTSTYKYTVPVTGYYQVNTKTSVYDAESKIVVTRFILKVNGVDYQQSVSIPTATYNGAVHTNIISDTIYMVAGYEVYATIYVDTTDSGTSQLTTGSEAPYFSIHLLSVDA